MKIRILAVGKMKRGPHLELLEEYLKRSRWTVTIHEIDHDSKQNESEKLRALISPDDYVVLLDERGESMPSIEFARFLEAKQISGQDRLTFIIGGAEGPDVSIHARSNKKVAFGVQTWPHMFVRIMLVEQLYRAEQILQGHPYHKA